MTQLEDTQFNYREIAEARLVLQSFKKDGFYTVLEITWWVFHYEELSNYSYDHRHTGTCVEGLSCSCSWNSPESRFNDLHSTLKKIIELHHYENYFREEMVVIENIRDDHPALIQWIKKNEKLGTDDFLFFWTEWLQEDDKVVEPWIMNEQDLEIKFRAEEWESTIKFLEMFNDIFWTSDAYAKV